MKTAYLTLLSLSLLPACFTSTGLDDGCTDPNPCAWEEVPYCEEGRECEVLDWCGATIYCSLNEIIDPPVTCTEPRPVCADSYEVSECPPGATCMPFEWCGETYYCASEVCNAMPPQCPAGEELSYDACAPGEVECTEVAGCGESFYCRLPIDCFDPIFEPCDRSTSTVWNIGEGSCPDFDSGAYCTETNYCGGEYYCVTACAAGDTEVFHPSECANSSDCYPSNPWRDDLPLSWCQGGGGPACRAIPTCEGGEEIPLDALCDDDGYCEYRSQCSTTIQCYFGIVLG